MGKKGTIWIHKNIYLKSYRFNFRLYNSWIYKIGGKFLYDFIKNFQLKWNVFLLKNYNNSEIDKWETPIFEIVERNYFEEYLESEFSKLSYFKNLVTMDFINKNWQNNWDNDEHAIIVKEELLYHPVIAMMEYAEKTAELSDVLMAFIDHLGYMEEEILDCLFPVC